MTKRLKIRPAGWASILVGLVAVVAFGSSLGDVSRLLEPEQYRVAVAAFVFMAFGLAGWAALELWALGRGKGDELLSPIFQRLIRLSWRFRVAFVATVTFGVSLALHWWGVFEW